MTAAGVDSLSRKRSRFCV